MQRWKENYSLKCWQHLPDYIKFRFRGICCLPTHTTFQYITSKRSFLLPSQQKLTTADTASLNSNDRNSRLPSFLTCSVLNSSLEMGSASLCHCLNGLFRFLPLCNTEGCDRYKFLIPEGEFRLLQHPPISSLRHFIVLVALVCRTK